MPCPRVTIGLFADAHYAHLVYGDRYCEDSLAKLRVCMDTFNIRQPDLVINLGDLIDKAATYDRIDDSHEVTAGRAARCAFPSTFQYANTV